MGLQQVPGAGKLSLFYHGFFNSYHEKEDKFLSEAGVQGILYYNILNSLRVGAGLNYNKMIGLQPKVSVLYTYAENQFVLVASIAGGITMSRASSEVFVRLGYDFKVNEKWSLFSQAQLFALSYGLTEHARSSVQLRLGPSLKKLQFGLAVDFDQYGKYYMQRTIPGFFVRADL